MAVNTFNVMDIAKARLFDPQEMGYRDSLDIIMDESVKIKKSFVKIGWYLKHIRDNELYLEGGYADINECAAAQLGYSQSTVSRFINICEKFSKEHNSPELDDKYANFDKSQMIEMLPLEESELLEKVTPDMSVREIREIKKETKTGRSPEKIKTKEEILQPEERQTSLEEDFPQYLPDSDKSDKPDLQEENDKYATSHEVPDEDKPEEAVVIDGTCREIQEQLDFPQLKNNDQRKEWLANYKAWGLWYRDENIDVNYYKFDFADGSRLVAAEYPMRRSYYVNEWEDECFYHLLKKIKKDTVVIKLMMRRTAIEKIVKRI